MNILQKQLNNTEEVLSAKQVEWQKNKQQLEEKLYEHKSKRREEIGDEMVKRKELEREISDYNEWIMELAQELKDASVKEQEATRKLNKSKALAYKQLQKLRKETQTRRDTEDELVNVAKALSHTEEELQIANFFVRVVKRYKTAYEEGMGCWPT